MANFNIDITGKDPTGPTVDNSSAILSSTTYIFKTSDFTTNFIDADLDGFGEVTLKKLPSVIQLKLLGADAVLNNTLHANDASSLKLQLNDKYTSYNGVLYEFEKELSLIIAEYNLLGYKLTSNTAGALTFTDPDNTSDEFVLEGTVVDNSRLTLDFTIRDDSENELESNIATVSLVPTGDINIKAIYVNNPPVIGDNTVSTKYDETIVFTRNDFVENTDPRFSDPEGDQPYKLKILSLPANGTLYLRGVEIIINQELLFVGDIDQAVFTYTPDSTRTDIASVVFDFTINDTGSKIYA